MMYMLNVSKAAHHHHHYQATHMILMHIFVLIYCKRYHLFLFKTGFRYTLIYIIITIKYISEPSLSVLVNKNSISVSGRSVVA